MKNRKIKSIYSEYIKDQSIFYNSKTNKLEKQNTQISKTLEDLKTISQIGADITRALSASDIVSNVYDSIKQLMDADIFGIGVFDEDQQKLIFKGTIEKNRLLLDYSYNINDKEHFAVHSFVNNKSILINDFKKEAPEYFNGTPEPVAGDTPRSLIYLPLTVGDEQFGVITVQSFNLNAYNEYHLNILKPLSIYISIAYTNSVILQRIENQAEELSKLNATKDKFF